MYCLIIRYRNYIYHVNYYSCSDGCARSGTFITICYTLNRLNIEGLVDIFHALKVSRLHRAGLVSNVVSNVFCTMASSVKCLTLNVSVY